MFSIQNCPIHDIDERCNLPTRKGFDHNIAHNYNDLYGDRSHYRERFNDLGVPIFIVQLNKPDNVPEQQSYMRQDGVISDELFDKLFDRVEVKPKYQKQKTIRKRKKKMKGKSKGKTKRKRS